MSPALQLRDSATSDCFARPASRCAPPSLRACTRSGRDARMPGARPKRIPLKTEITVVKATTSNSTDEI